MKLDDAKAVLSELEADDLVFLAWLPNMEGRRPYLGVVDAGIRS